MYKIHRGSFNAKYSWETVRKENPDLLVPTGQMGADDLCWQCVTYENLDQWCSNYKVMLLKLGFAINEPNRLPNNVVGEITWVRALLPWLIQFNKTEIEAGIILDESGPHGKTCSNSNLNHSGS